MNLGAFVFDLDGMLFQTKELPVPPFRQTFEQLLKSEQITRVFGMTTRGIWEKLLPDTSDESKAHAYHWLLENE